MCYSLYFYLYLYLYLYHVLLREAMQRLAQPDRQEDENNMLVLVQKEVQAEVLELVQKQVQVEVQLKPLFSGIDLVKRHTAVPNVQASSYKQELVEAPWREA